MPTSNIPADRGASPSRRRAAIFRSARFAASNGNPDSCSAADSPDGGSGLDGATIGRFDLIAGPASRLTVTTISTASCGTRVTGGSGRNTLTVNAGNDLLVGNDGFCVSTAVVREWEQGQR